MRITSCSFERSAHRPEDEPRAPGPAVVFLGRSNVGKSSLINRLLGTKNLARTSSTPGRTQSVNFYRVNGTVWFVDLPGYGYAKVPASVRKGWGPMIEGFLERWNEGIALAILIVDARHEPTKMDGTMREWLEECGVRYVPVATKADKLSGNGRAGAQRTMRKRFPGGGLALEPFLVSAKTGMGIKTLWRHLDESLGS